MEVLINGVLKRGGERSRLQAKLFGGANVLAAMSDVGSRNAVFAKKFLADEGIRLVGGDVGGLSPRRIQYWPTLGRARQLAVKVDARALVQREREEAAAVAAPSDDVELF